LSERTPWGNFVRTSSVSAEDSRPLCAYAATGAWLTPAAAGHSFSGHRRTHDRWYPEYRDGTFTDVSAQVRDGTRPVQFYNARPDQN
jgi:hypothetical protein